MLVLDLSEKGYWSSGVVKDNFSDQVWRGGDESQLPQRWLAATNALVSVLPRSAAGNADSRPAAFLHCAVAN